MVLSLLAASGVLIPASSGTLAQANDIFGQWYTKDRESKVRLYPCGARLCGEVVALKAPVNTDGSPLLDINNKDRSLRDRPILGLRILWDFELASNSRWEEGAAYDPKDGQTYDDVQIELTGDNSLEIGGCVLWGAICQTQVWARVPP